MNPTVVMVGAGGAFTHAVTKGLCETPALHGTTFVLLDINKERLDRAEGMVQRMVQEANANIKVKTTMNRRKAFEGANYVVSSLEQDRWNFWLKDLKIPEKFGVHQMMSENGGPGGQIHGMRNITLFMGICKDMQEVCPNAWMMNFTNPLSFVATYLHNHTSVKNVGFCHGVHGGMGVIAEMLGFEPGELVAVTGGVNHFSWLLDIRRRNHRESFMPEFVKLVRKNKYWKKHYPSISDQRFTLEMLNSFGSYVTCYDDHILEYLPFFYERSEWKKHGIESKEKHLRETIRCQKLKIRRKKKPYPFPKDGKHPYYHENQAEVMVALETSTPMYLDNINIKNRGCIPNLPYDAVVDIPGVVAGGEVRGVAVGNLPEFGAELCRRQITIHELVAKACVTGDRQLALQALALDPYVRSITQAKGILDAYLNEYRKQLPQFH